MERLVQSHDSEGQTSLSATLTIAEETSQMAIDDNSPESRSSECGSLLTEEKNDFHALRNTPFLSQTKQLEYLAYSYNRTLIEEKNYSKVTFVCRHNMEEPIVGTYMYIVHIVCK